MHILSEKISYIPSSESPLSADVVFVQASDCTWIFDVGRTDESLSAISGIAGPRAFVISHFHGDHMENMARISLRDQDRVYVGRLTAKKLAGIVPEGQIIVVTESVTLGDVTVFPMPSSHEKGCLGLMADGIAFLGDAAYTLRKDSVTCYNTSLLHETIRTLTELPVDSLFLSHGTGLRDRNGLLRSLRYIYRHRAPGEAYINCNSLE